MNTNSDSSLWNWAFKYKYISAAISVLYGPILEGALKYYAHKQQQDFSPTPSSEEEMYVLLGILGYAFNIQWLSLFEKVQRPRIRNMIRATQGAGEDIIGSILRNPELSRRGIKRFYGATQFLGPEQVFQIEAEYQLRKGNLGEAVDLYARYLDERRERKTGIDEYVASPLTRIIIQAKARWRGDLQDRLEEAILDLSKNHSHLFEKTWPRIIEKDKTLEIRIIHAMFLSICNRPEAQQAWADIAHEPHITKKEGNSRNDIFELDLPFLREIVLIKKGKGCQREWEALCSIQKQDPDLIARPLAFYEEEGEYVLITKRKARKDLEVYLTQETDPEKRREEIRTVLGRIKRFHKISFEAQDYNPSKEIERRLIQRKGYGRKAELFLQEYKKFEERKREGEEKVTCHGDLYPSNVLQGGILIDVERITRASPWLDIETLLAAPHIDPEELEAELQDISPPGREFYQVHTALCQIGSFSRKNPAMSQRYKALAIRRLEKQREETLSKRLKNYVIDEA